MRKKALARALALVMSLSLCLGVLPGNALAVDSGCSTCGGTGMVSGDQTCEHCYGYGSYGEIDWSTGALKEVTCPGCNGTGKAPVTCPDCGGISPEECEHSHTDWRLAEEATCTQKGRIELFCTDCGKVINPNHGRPPIALGHSKDTVKKVVKKATCTEPEQYQLVCTRCGEPASAQTYQGDTLGHDWTAAGPGEELGTVKFTCSRCGEEMTSTCEHKSTVTTTVEPTCTSTGRTTTTCAECGTTINETLISAAGHSWDNGVMQSGSANVVYTCTVCGKTDIYYNVSGDESTQPTKPYEREVEVNMAFQNGNGVSFGKDEIPEGFKVTCSYEWNGQTYTIELPLTEAEVILKPKAYQDENGKWVYDDPSQGEYTIATWKIKVPVDPTTGDPRIGTILNVTESGFEIDGYEWDHAYGYNPSQSTDGTGILHIRPDGTPVTWVYNVYAKLAQYTVNYYHDGVLVSSSSDTGRVGSNILYSTANRTSGEQTYVYTGFSGDTTIADGGSVLNVYFALRTPDPDPDPDPDPAPTPDPLPVLPAPDPTPAPAPADPGTTIVDEEVPLAGTVGLNDVEHFAYIIGYDNDTVRPLDNLTRAEAVTIFFRLMTDEYRAANWSTENSFADVSAGSWYNNAISTCLKAGALEAFASEANFLPNQAITRAEFAALAAGFIEDTYTGETVGDFSDTEGHWAAEYIRKAVEAGWITGDGGAFRPDELITRAEVMTMVNRMLDRVPDADRMLPDMKVWTDNPEGTSYYADVQEATNEHAYERDEMGVVETWTGLKTARDWKALEEEWAMNGGSSAPEAEESEAE